MKLVAVTGVSGFSIFMVVFGCFLVGCCGSPMLAVYAGIFGSFRSIGKVVDPGRNIAFYWIRLWWIRRNEKKCLSNCDCITESSKPEL
jgi:hypothetical protein